MRADLFVYLSGPITAREGVTVEENVASALKVYLDCLRRGIPAFCPHLSAGFASSFDVAYETWLDYDCAVLTRCTHFLLLPRWESSSGAKRELAYAKELGLPVVFDVAEVTA